MVNAYTLTFAGFLLLGGRASDLLGRRRVFVVGLVAVRARLAGRRALREPGRCSIGARAAQGLGGAVVAPATLAIITTTFAEGPSATARSACGAPWAAPAAPPGRCSAAC